MTNYSDATAVPGTRYYYWTKAVCSLSTSAFSASANAVRPLGAPTNVTANGTTAAITVGWAASTGATSYEVWRNTSNASGSATKLGTATVTNYIDATAVPGTRYYYWTKAVCSLSTSAFSASANAVRPLGAPTNVTASGTAAAITVGWAASTGATSYEVWRNTSNASGSATKLGTATVTNYSDATAVPGTRYYYWTKAVCSLSTSAFSASANAVRPLGASTNVTAIISAVTSNRASLAISWSAVYAATSYELWRGTGDTPSTASRIATTTGTNWVDTGVTGFYTYWIAAKCGALTSWSEGCEVAIDLMPLRSLLTGLEARNRDGILSDKELTAAMNNPGLADMDGDPTTISDEEMEIFLWIQRLNEDKDLISSVIAGTFSGIDSDTLWDMGMLSFNQPTDKVLKTGNDGK